MTKLRDPDSFEDALVQARALLGDTRVCEISGRRISLIKAWSDADDDKRSLPVHVARLLDRELHAQGHERLFRRIFEMDEELTAAPVAAIEEPPLEQAMSCVTAAARTLENTRGALKDQHIQPHERIALLKEATTLQRCLGAFKRSLFVKPPPKKR